MVDDEPFGVSSHRYHNRSGWKLSPENVTSLFGTFGPTCPG